MGSNILKARQRKEKVVKVFRVELKKNQIWNLAFLPSNV